MNGRELHQWEVYFGSGNGWVPSGNRQLPELVLIQNYVTMAQCFKVNAQPFTHKISVITLMINNVFNV